MSSVLPKLRTYVARLKSGAPHSKLRSNNSKLLWPIGQRCKSQKADPDSRDKQAKSSNLPEVYLRFEVSLQQVTKAAVFNSETYIKIWSTGTLEYSSVCSREVGSGKRKLFVMSMRVKQRVSSIQMFVNINTIFNRERDIFVWVVLAPESLEGEQMTREVQVSFSQYSENRAATVVLHIVTTRHVAKRTRSNLALQPSRSGPPIKDGFNITKQHTWRAKFGHFKKFGAY